MQESKRSPDSSPHSSAFLIAKKLGPCMFFSTLLGLSAQKIKQNKVPIKQQFKPFDALA